MTAGQSVVDFVRRLVGQRQLATVAEQTHANVQTVGTQVDALATQVQSLAAQVQSLTTFIAEVGTTESTIKIVREITGQRELATLAEQAHVDLQVVRSQMDALTRQVDFLTRLINLPEPRTTERAKKIGRYLAPQQALNTRKRRFGRDRDGGYVLLDDLADQAVALSFGVGDDASWDADIAAQGVLVHQFDHTIPAPPIVHERIVFHPQRIVAAPAADGATLEQILQAQNISAPASAILKIDIEGDEWSVLDSTPEEALDRFSQIVCEFHNFRDLGDDRTFATCDRVLTKLNRHFQSVHVHANNSHPMILLGGVPFPDILEVTFANRSRYQFGDSTETFPTPLDRPNWHRSVDYYLGRFDFQ